ERCLAAPQPPLGRRYHLHRPRDPLRLSRCDPGCLVTASCRLCNRQTGRCAFGACRPASRHRRAPAATRVHPSLRSRFAVRGRRLPRGARQPRPQGFDGPTWQPYDNAKAESFIKQLKVEEVFLMEYEAFDDIAPLCRASSKTSIMPSVATRRWDTKAPSTLKRNTPGRWPIEQPHTCPPQGVHSRRCPLHDRFDLVSGLSLITS